MKLGSLALAMSQIFGFCTNGLACFQNLISHSSRKYQPLATIP